MKARIVWVVVGLAAGSLSATDAMAGCCGCAWSASRSAARTVITNVNLRIDEMERKVVETLELQTGKLSGYIAKSAEAVTGALDTRTKLQAQIRLDGKSLRCCLQAAHLSFL